MDCVGEDDLLEGLALIARVATLMDKLHLLENGRLSRLSGTYATVSKLPRTSEAGGRTKQQHLDLIALVLLVLEKLILNGGITSVPFLFLCRGTATHLD